MGGAAVGEIPHQGHMDDRAIPVALFQEGVRVDELSQGARVLAVACIDKGGPGDAELLCVARQHGLQPAADTLQRAPDDEDAALCRINRQHLHGVRDRLVLLEGRRLCLELVHLDAMIGRGIPERFPCARGALHEEQVHSRVRQSNSLIDVAIFHLAERGNRRSLARGAGMPLPQLAGALIEVELLLETQVVDNLDGPTGEW
mmetsp:Transcript_137522/g.293935  ORF Transcript_137522/g.293935 Transcript_137522/m.293935 type:complete len:202 (-) Transcript_137522:123-728(-)